MTDLKSIQSYIKALSYDEMCKLKLFLNSSEYCSIYNHKQEKHFEEIRNITEKNRSARIKSEEKFNTEILPYLKIFINNHLREGDIVQFKGASNNGFRKVVSINSSRGTIIGFIVTHARGIWHLKGYSSENSYDKLKGIWCSSLSDRTSSDTPCWFGLKEIVEFVKNSSK